MSDAGAASRLVRAGGAGALACAALLASCAPRAEPPAWTQPPPPAEDAAVTAPGALTRATLDNGLKVLLLEDHRLPRVVIGVAVRRGAGDEPPHQAGLARYTGELMKRGAGARDALALARAIEEMGARLTVALDWDAVTVSIAGLSRDLDRLVEALADIVLRPRFDAVEARKARAEQLAALERAKDEPATLVDWHAQRALYGAHRYAFPLDGTPESVARLSAAAAVAFHRAVFVPNDAIVFASGDMDPSEWRGRVRRSFGSPHWRPAPVLAPAPAPPASVPTARRVIVVDRPDLVQARIVLAHEGIARTDDRRIAAELMSNVLGGSGFSSRLMASARSEAGLTYAVWSGFSLRREPGPFRVITFTRVPETRRMIDLLLAGLVRLRNEPPTDTELANAKSYTVGRFALSLESPEAVATALVSLEIYHLPADSLDTFRQRVRAITTADTSTVARALVHPERTAIVVVGPAATLAPELESLGPVEVVTP
jgi:zinc protease